MSVGVGRAAQRVGRAGRQGSGAGRGTDVPCALCLPLGGRPLAPHDKQPGGFLQGLPQDVGEHRHPEPAHLGLSGVLDRVHDCEHILR